MNAYLQSCSDGRGLHIICIYIYIYTHIYSLAVMAGDYILYIYIYIYTYFSLSLSLSFSLSIYIYTYLQSCSDGTTNLKSFWLSLKVFKFMDRRLKIEESQKVLAVIFNPYLWLSSCGWSHPAQLQGQRYGLKIAAKTFWDSSIFNLRSMKLIFFSETLKLFNLRMFIENYQKVSCLCCVPFPSRSLNAGVCHALNTDRL